MDHLENYRCPDPTFTKDENKALAELKWDKERTILTADKGVAMVVLDKKDDIEKVQELPAYWLTQPYKETPATN